MLMIFCGLFTGSIRAQPSNAVVPLVGAGFLFGGVKNGRWLTAAETVPFLKEKNDFRLIGLTGRENKGSIFSSKKGNSWEVCPEVRQIEFESKPGFTGFAVGVDGGWDLLPRPLEPRPLTGKTDLKTVADFLGTKGLSKPKIKLGQVFRVDLDGDRENEFIITGNFYKRGIDQTPSAGDYSFVLLRKAGRGTARNIVVEGEFFKRTGKNTPPPNVREVAAVADLNGDGKLELLIYGNYYEGEWANVYELRGNKFLKIFAVECGA
jgi:hypothetical protein